MNNNVKIKLLITILILLLTVFIIQFVIIKIKNETPEDRTIREFGAANIGIEQDNEVEGIDYKNIFILEEFNGELPISKVIAKVDKAFKEEIPEILDETKNMSDAKLSEYFSRNSLDILNNLRIRNEESFLNMIKEFQNLSANPKTDYKSCEFFDNGNIYLIFTYNTGEQIQCDIEGEHANLITFEF